MLAAVFGRMSWVAGLAEAGCCEDGTVLQTFLTNGFVLEISLRKQDLRRGRPACRVQAQEY